MMDAAVNRFICALKRSGIGISPAEAIDAMQALACVRLADRETTRSALRTTLIKNIRDLATFEELFALFFGASAPAPAAETGPEPEVSASPGLPEGRRVVLDTDDDGIPIDTGGGGDKRDGLKLQPGTLEELARNLVVKRAQAMLDQVMERAAHQVNVRSVRAGTRPGALNYGDALPSLDADLMLQVLEQLLRDVRDLDADDRPSDGEQRDLATVIEQLPETLRRYLERQLAREAQRAEALQARSSVVSQAFTESERLEMEEIVRRLGRRMRGARSYRRVVSHHGRVNVGRTLRRSMAYDGIPFTPVIMGPRFEKPRLVLICDVSLSVRTTARFTLHLVYSLQSLFDQVRSFVFVSDLADASQYFEQFGIDEAIAAIFGGKVIDCDANSNYGRALDIFHRRHISTVNGQTTVIILGDGRGNRNPPNLAALEEVRRRARQVIWLSSEPRGSWGLGGSDMPLYAPVCHRAEVVRNLSQLGEVADSLIRNPSAAPRHG